MRDMIVSIAVPSFNLTSNFEIDQNNYYYPQKVLYMPLGTLFDAVLIDSIFVLSGLLVSNFIKEPIAASGCVLGMIAGAGVEMMRVATYNSSDSILDSLIAQSSKFMHLAYDANYLLYDFSSHLFGIAQATEFPI